MKITSGGSYFTYETEDLIKPDGNLATVISEELSKAPNTADFYIVKDEPFSACAFISEDNTYSVCLSGFALQWG